MNEPISLVFATNNEHKLAEIQAVLSGAFRLKTLKQINCLEEIPETQATIEGNASQKAHYVADNYKLPCFADDTGLEIEALNGKPGVHSAYYAGEERSAEKNCALVLEQLAQQSNRTARFKTIISLIMDEKEIQFEGIVSGKIADSPRGTNGFGYDAIFIPDGSNFTFAEMSAEQKNAISHRSRAFAKLVEYLNSAKQLN